MVKRTGEQSHKWKGDKVKYSGIHAWLTKNYGQPRICSKCKTKNAKCFEWANISGEYKRDINDFKRLCVKCHRNMDKESYQGEKNSNSKLTNKEVLKIIEIYKDNKYSLREIAKDFKITHSNILAIINKKTWRHIQ